jgi:hypothetical protein
MKRCALLTLVVLMTSSVVVVAQDAPQMPKPQKEHAWLEQLAGDWQWQSKVTMGPNGPTMEGAGTESISSLGGFWIVSETEGRCAEMDMNARMTLGYDTEKNKYVGTWVGSICNHLWTYEGDVSEDGKSLVLYSEGPCPMKPGELSKFKEVITIKSPTEREFTSSRQNEDGSWTKFMTITYQRKS